MVYNKFDLFYNKSWVLILGIELGSWSWVLMEHRKGKRE